MRGMPHSLSGRGLSRHPHIIESLGIAVAGVVFCGQPRLTRNGWSCNDAQWMNDECGVVRTAERCEVTTASDNY